MKILYFAHVAKTLGRREDELSCPAPVTAEVLWEKLLVLRPGLAQYRSSIHLARNSEYAEAQAMFADADEVALIPPVSGG
jgi:molybdopterin synthase catalytic subunit